MLDWMIGTTLGLGLLILALTIRGAVLRRRALLALALAEPVSVRRVSSSVDSRWCEEGSPADQTCRLAGLALLERVSSPSAPPPPPSLPIPLLERVSSAPPPPAKRFLPTPPPPRSAPPPPPVVAPEEDDSEPTERTALLSDEIELDIEVILADEPSEPSQRHAIVPAAPSSAGDVSWLHELADTIASHRGYDPLDEEIDDQAETQPFSHTRPMRRRDADEEDFRITQRRELSRLVG